MANPLGSESVPAGEVSVASVGTIRWMRDALGRTPWWAASAILHLFILITAMSIGFATRPVETKGPGTVIIEVGGDLKPPVYHPPAIECPRGLLEFNEEPMIYFPTGEDSTHNESADEQDTHEMMGRDRRFISWEEGRAGGISGDSVSDKPALFSVLGIGSGWGGAGRYGGPIGGRFDLKKRINCGATEDAVLQGLRWLARHQSPDGHWSGERFDAVCRGAARCAGPGSRDHDVGLTGLALLAFLGAGNLPTTRSRESVFEDPFEKGRVIRFADVVRKGLSWLRDGQGAEGCFGKEEGEFLYDHAIATLAMTEAAWLSATPLYRDPAQRGIDFIQRARNPGLAWRYGVRPGDNDTSVTGWCVMALKSAELAGLRFDRAAYDGVRTWLGKVTGAKGVVGYVSPGDAGSTIPGINDRWQGHPAMTAVGLLARIFIDRKQGDPWMRLAAHEILRDLPAWDEEHRTIDFYYWYYAALALFQLDSGKGQVWGVFNQAMVRALVPFQEGEGEGCRRGSWNPAVDRWGSVGGRVYATAINVLTLEVYYRYKSVFTGGERQKA